MVILSVQPSMRPSACLRRRNKSTLFTSYVIIILIMRRRRGDNPFAVISPEREPVTGALFKKQIHRADLTVSDLGVLVRFRLCILPGPQCDWRRSIWQSVPCSAESQNIPGHCRGYTCCQVAEEWRHPEGTKFISQDPVLIIHLSGQSRVSP